MRKTLYTLNVDGYAPELCKLTYPWLEFYADKIGAKFHVISERKWPHMPPVYEKLQIYELAQESGDDWNIYIDSDALVHPETVDWTALLDKDTVAHNGSDMAAVRWKYDGYFLRDGRNIGSCNWMTIASDWCIDLWRPLDDLTPEQAYDNIIPTVGEKQAGITREHLIDDYVLSRNIARFGLKFTTLKQLQADHGMPDANFYWHVYTESIDAKIAQMKQVIETWGLNGWK